MDFILSIVVPIIQVLLAFLGVTMVTHDDWVKRHKTLVISSFILLSAIGVFISVYQSRQTEKNQTALANALLQINDRTAALARLQGQNNNLQGQLVKSNDEIRTLSVNTLKETREAVKQVTGNGGYVYVVPMYAHIDPQLGIAIPNEIPVSFAVFNPTKYPTIDISLSIDQPVPVGTGDLITAPGFEPLRSDAVSIFFGRVGDSFPGALMLRINPRVAAMIRKDQDNIYDTVLFSRSGTLTQRIVISWNGTGWKDDYKLERVVENGKKIEVLHEIAKDFPYIKKP